MKNLEIELSIVNSDETIEKLTQIRDLSSEIKSTLESIKASQIEIDIRCDSIVNESDLDALVDNLNSKLLHSKEL